LKQKNRTQNTIGTIFKFSSAYNLISLELKASELPLSSSIHSSGTSSPGTASTQTSFSKSKTLV